ncbi:MAG TPA: c-type cytochrome [Gemmatimonadaceae bacterium]|nr:c-type cytochrome [Gemmatimonadaceae bacterium]
MWRTNLKVLGLTVVVLGFYTGIGHIIPQLESDVPEVLAFGADVTPEALVAAGERVFHGAGACTACHGTGTRAPNLLADHGGEGQIGARCGTRVAGLSCKDYLHQSMIEPGAHVVPGFDNIMPDARRQIPEDQIWAIVAFLESLGGEVTVTSEDLPSPGAAAAPGAPTAAGAPAAFSATVDGETLVREKGCVACHVLDGVGAPIGPPFDGMGRRLTADQIRRGILDPNAEIAAGYEQFAGMMPATFADQLSAAQLEAIVRYLGGRR